MGGVLDLSFIWYVFHPPPFPWVSFLCRPAHVEKSRTEHTRSSLSQDKFDHDKGQKSAISGRRLHWRLSTGFFAFSPVFVCNLVRRAPQNLEKVAKNPVEKITSNPVTSVAVMVISALIKRGPEIFLEGVLWYVLLPTLAPPQTMVQLCCQRFAKGAKY